MPISYTFFQPSLHFSLTRFSLYFKNKLLNKWNVVFDKDLRKNRFVDKLKKRILNGRVLDNN